MSEKRSMEIVITEMMRVFRTKPGYGQWVEEAFPENRDDNGDYICCWPEGFSLDNFLDKIVGLPRWHPDDSFESAVWQVFPDEEKNEIWDAINHLDENARNSVLVEVWLFLENQTPFFMVEEGQVRFIAAAYKECPLWIDLIMEKIEERQN
tara:strand:+ start:95 stop:547 length:453 start_codon:yes stop_codon:yes gene_type:complete